jgi:hypothetical protein
MDTLRRATLTTLADSLQSRKTRALDVVVPSKSLTFVNDTLDLNGVPVTFGEPAIPGVDATREEINANGLYTPTRVALEGLAAKLSIPLRYLAFLAESHVDLFAHNVNTLADRGSGKYLLRLLRAEDETDAYGTLRAVLSDTYKTIDDFDILLAVLSGMREAGATDSKIEADLTDRRMVVRVHNEGIATHARSLVDGYRSPFSGKTGAELPMLFAGFVVTNSEVGNGAFNIDPRGVFQVCDNGMTITKDRKRKVHLGSRLDEGVVQWSDKTLAAQLALVKAQTEDAVRTFLSAEYWDTKVTEIEAEAATPVDDAPAVITGVSKALGFTQDVANDVLNAFIDGGKRTAGGVMQAVTASAQRQSDGDVALDMENAALEALRLAAHPRTLARTSARS